MENTTLANQTSLKKHTRLLTNTVDKEKAPENRGQSKAW